jgi:hypothetical protein
VTNDGHTAQSDKTEETVQAQRSDATPRDGTTQIADTVYSSATPPLTQVENEGRAKAATEADGPERDSRYGTVCYYAMREKSNLLVIVAYATDISPPEFFFLPDSSGDYRLPPGAAVRFWETDEPFNAGRRYGMRIYDCEQLFLEEVRPLTATIHPRSQLNRRQLGTKGIVGSRRVNGRLVNGIFPENTAMRFLYFDESLDARRCWPPPGTAVIATAVATADSEDAMLADVHLQDEQFQNMHQAIPRALVKHMNEHHLPTDTVTAMIGGDTSCDLPARNLMGSRAVRGHGDVPQLLREMLEYNRAQLNKAGEELQRIKERQTLVRALEKGEKIVLFVSTPFYNKFHWKRLFDAYFSRVTSGPTVSQVMLLADFDARAVDAEQPFASTDFGEMITLDPGSDSTESFLVFTNPMPWEDDYQDGNLNFVTSRVGRKLFGLWLLSMKGCERSRSATGFPPLTYDRLFGRQPESRELSLAQPYRNHEAWVRYANGNQEACERLLAQLLVDQKGKLIRVGHKQDFETIPGLTSWILRPTAQFRSTEAADQHDQVMVKICQYLATTGMFFAMPAKDIYSRDSTMITLKTRPSFPHDPATLQEMLYPLTKPRPTRTTALAFPFSPTLFRIKVSLTEDRALSQRRRLEKIFRRYNSATGRDRGMNTRHGEPIVAFYAKTMLDPASKILYLGKRKWAGNVVPWAGAFQHSTQVDAAIGVSYVLGADPAFSNAAVLAILRECGVDSSSRSATNATFADRGENMTFVKTVAGLPNQVIRVPAFTPFLSVPHYTEDDRVKFLGTPSMVIPGMAGVGLMVVSSDGATWKDNAKCKAVATDETNGAGEVADVEKKRMTRITNKVTWGQIHRKHIASAHALARKDIAMEKRERAQEEEKKRRQDQKEKKAEKERDDARAKQAAKKAAKAPDSEGYVTVQPRGNSTSTRTLRPRNETDEAREGETEEVGRGEVEADRNSESTPPNTPHVTHKGYLATNSVNSADERIYLQLERKASVQGTQESEDAGNGVFVSSSLSTDELAPGCVLPAGGRFWKKTRVDGPYIIHSNKYDVYINGQLAPGTEPTSYAFSVNEPKPGTFPNCRWHELGLMTERWIKRGEELTAILPKEYKRWRSEARQKAMDDAGEEYREVPDDGFSIAFPEKQVVQLVKDGASKLLREARLETQDISTAILPSDLVEDRKNLPARGQCGPLTCLVGHLCDRLAQESDFQEACDQVLGPVTNGQFEKDHDLRRQVAERLYEYARSEDAKDLIERGETDVEKNEDPILKALGLVRQTVVAAMDQLALTETHKEQMDTKDIRHQQLESNQHVNLQFFVGFSHIAQRKVVITQFDEQTENGTPTGTLQRHDRVYDATTGDGGLQGLCVLYSRCTPTEGKDLVSSKADHFDLIHGGTLCPVIPDAAKWWTTPKKNAFDELAAGGAKAKAKTKTSKKSNKKAGAANQPPPISRTTTTPTAANATTALAGTEATLSSAASPPQK